MTNSFNSQEQALDAIKHLRLDFTGCEYETLLDGEIKKEFSEYDINPVIRGQKAPAAGAGLNADIVITVATGIASGLIVEAIKAALGKIRKATSAALNKNCYLGYTTIETDTCDYIIRACAGAGVQSEDIDYSRLIEKMMQLHNEELDSGHTIIRIETPYEVTSHSDGFSIEQSDLGSFSLWKVTYVGGERWPFQYYDAANECFIATRSDIEMAAREDIFYSGPRY